MSKNDTPKTFAMVNPKEDNKFEERTLHATSREDAKAEGMGIVRVLNVKSMYLMEKETEVIFFAHDGS